MFNLDHSFLTKQPAVKHLTYLSIFFIAAIFFSCKKENQPPTNTDLTLSSKDPVALSKSIKVWHGLRLQGAVPATVGGANAPVIEAPVKEIIRSFAGKFAFVKPKVVSGNIAGYYVGVKGAADYFKIDYSKARITERQAYPKRKGASFKIDSTGGGSGYMDSLIVITLPINFKTPDTFCVTYSAYDELGNISEPVTSCIIVSKLGGDASTNFLEATWRMFSRPSDTSFYAQYDTIHYGKWRKGTYFTEYFCNKQSDGSSQIGSYCSDIYAPCIKLNITDSVNETENDLVLTNNGSMTYKYSSKSKDINLTTSVCSLVNYDINPYRSNFTGGGWSITGDKMIFVFEYDNNGSSALDAVEFVFEKINEAEFRIISTEDDEEIYIFKKL